MLVSRRRDSSDFVRWPISTPDLEVDAGQRGYGDAVALIDLSDCLEPDNCFAKRQRVRRWRDRIGARPRCHRSHRLVRLRCVKISAPIGSLNVARSSTMVVTLPGLATGRISHLVGMIRPPIGLISEYVRTRTTAPRSS